MTIHQQQIQSQHHVLSPSHSMHPLPPKNCLSLFYAICPEKVSHHCLSRYYHSLSGQSFQSTDTFPDLMLYVWHFSRCLMLQLRPPQWEVHFHLYSLRPRPVCPRRPPTLIFKAKKPDGVRAPQPLSGVEQNLWVLIQRLLMDALATLTKFISTELDLVDSGACVHTFHNHDNVCIVPTACIAQPTSASRSPNLTAVFSRLFLSFILFSRERGC